MAWIDDDVMPSWNRVPLASGARGTSPGETVAVRHDTEQLQRPGEVPPAICSAWPTTRSTRRRQAAR